MNQIFSQQCRNVLCNQNVNQYNYMLQRKNTMSYFLAIPQNKHYYSLYHTLMAGRMLSKSYVWDFLC